jgi:hypothetical protein
MFTYDPKHTELISLVYRISDYYKIIRIPEFVIDGDNITITIHSGNEEQVKNVAQHLKILGFKDIEVNYKENIYIFSNQLPLSL